MRLVSVQRGKGFAESREAVGQRARGCRRPADFGNCRGFGAVHMFPLACEGGWVGKDYGRWITFLPSTGGSFKGVQNGSLLPTDVHILSDRYDVSINPDVSPIFRVIF